MNNGTTVILALTLLVALGIGTYIFAKRKGGAQKNKARLRGPFGMAIATESSSEVTPGVRIHDATSEEGGLAAEDKTGRGVDVRKLKTKHDIKITNAAPPGLDGGSDPK